MIYTVFSYSITSPEGTPLFSVTIQGFTSKSFITFVVPSPHFSTSNQIMNYIANSLQLKHTDITWKPSLAKPEDVERYS